MVVGIYCIFNHKDGKVYIGSSIDIERRWSTHRYKLLNNKHENRYLQNAWNKYGEALFEFVLLDVVSVKNLIKEEQVWLDRWTTFNRDCGYNLCPKADNHLGLKFSEEVKQKMSESRKGKNAPWYGKHLTDTMKQKLHNCNVGENSPTALLSWSEVRKIREYWNNGMEVSELIEIFKVSKSCIQGVTSGRNWKDSTYMPIARGIGRIPDNVRYEIFQIVKNGTSQLEVANLFRISQQSVSNIVREFSKC